MVERRQAGRKEEKAEMARVQQAKEKEDESWGQSKMGKAKVGKAMRRVSADHLLLNVSLRTVNCLQNAGLTDKEKVRAFRSRINRQHAL
jgi:hypothetical protein